MIIRMRIIGLTYAEMKEAIHAGISAAEGFLVAKADIETYHMVGMIKVQVKCKSEGTTVIGGNKGKWYGSDPVRLRALGSVWAILSICNGWCDGGLTYNRVKVRLENLEYVYCENLGNGRETIDPYIPPQPEPETKTL